MQQTAFLGEHVMWGQLGHTGIVLALITSLLTAISFFMAERTQDLDKNWESIGVWSFRIHVVSVISVITLLFGIIYNHYFEYYYAWQHSSLDLPVYYMISCFWEGQEGSFLLWIFWQMFIGVILMWRAGLWRNRVVAVIMLSQFALVSMLLGVHIFGYKFGSSPFELLRHAMKDAPIFKMPDYLSKIKDGNGLNPLLQNYWMVIHPPTLFFGFAATIVPFAYIISGLWKKDITGWVKPSFPWILITSVILGAGIIMGGFWAYESLNFGGYWAWDPVENASLVPWLVLIAALHVLLIYKHTGNSLRLAAILTLTAFILVLYATFLTRSGILGNSSVHSFTDLGMSGQLLVYLLLFVGLTIWLMSIRWSNFPGSEQDEKVYTREFWMLIGSLVLLVSAFQVTLTTSIPVINKVFHVNLAPPANPIAHYNKWQLPMALLIALFTGAAQLMRYRKNTDKAWKQLLIHAGISLVVSVGIFFATQLREPLFFGLLFAACYAISANSSLLRDLWKGRVQFTGSAISHVGFGILLIGVLISSANKKVISINHLAQALNNEFSNQENAENVYLEKGKKVPMGDYLVSYVSDSQIWVNTYYKVHYEKIDSSGKQLEAFDLHPNGQVNRKFGLVSNPDTKHYLSHDIFTYVSSVPNTKDGPKFGNETIHALKIGDTAYSSSNFAILKDLKSNISDQTTDIKKVEVLVTALLEVHTLDSVFMVHPMYAIKQNSMYSYDAISPDGNYKFSFTSIDPKTGKITIRSYDRDRSNEFIIMKAIVFPWINLVWTGTIVMIIGFFIAWYRRFYENRKMENS